MFLRFVDRINHPLRPFSLRCVHRGLCLRVSYLQYLQKERA